MPILPAEPMVYPDDLLDSASREDHSWWVLHVRPRQEKSLARQLRSASIPHYLPQAKNRVVVRRKVSYSYVPLFPGYTFLWGTEDERIAGLATGRVLRSIKVLDQDQLWNDLRQVNRLVASDLPVQTENRLQAGDEVEICSGPLMGLNGEIIRAAGGLRFVVRVDFIQRGASVLLDEANVTRIVERSLVATSV